MVIFVHCGVVRTPQITPKATSYIGKGLLQAVALWQNRDNFFLSRERLNCAGVHLYFRQGGELTRLTGLKFTKKEIS